MAEPSQRSQDPPLADDNDLEQDPDVGMAGTEEADNQAPPNQPVVPEAPGMAPPVPPPSRKDATLRELLSKMDDYAPIIPDAVTAHYLTLSGLPPPPLPGYPATPNSTPPQLARLLALATQKFIADIAADSYQYSRIRAGNTSSGTTMNALGIPAGQQNPGGVPGAAGGAGQVGDKGKAGGREAHLGQARPGYGGGGQGGAGQGRTVLTMEDLGMAVGEYGVNLKRSEFYR
ncbi:putative tfiid and and saga complex taf10 [Phaeomoniella chlamydospora]|uniref:Transcription initiation factor TFIID subunit 10 n=1 Tax=Phaeomoniella chlamydospora TaxID=158046 RepID=A0A0G2E6M4_PHACM|nr:putative tfiid and and saga complex taf10 [Phaeomoniella chlamydospora]